MKKYCASCGKPSVFSVSDKPKFCAGCGSKFDFGQNLTSSVAKKEETEEEAYGFEEEGESQEHSLPNMTKLDIDLEYVEGHTETLGSMIDNPIPNSSSDQPKRTTGKVSRKKFLEDFKKEAGSLRKNN
jgi:hypothetical protein